MDENVKRKLDCIARCNLPVKPAIAALVQKKWLTAAQLRNVKTSAELAAVVIPAVEKKPSIGRQVSDKLLEVMCDMHAETQLAGLKALRTKTEYLDGSSGSLKIVIPGHLLMGDLFETAKSLAEQRGVRFLPKDLYKAYAKACTFDEGKGPAQLPWAVHEFLRLSFTIVSNVAPSLSRDDFHSAFLRVLRRLVLLCIANDDDHGDGEAPSLDDIIDELKQTEAKATGGGARGGAGGGARGGDEEEDDPSAWFGSGGGAPRRLAGRADRASASTSMDRDEDDDGAAAVASRGHTARGAAATASKRALAATSRQSRAAARVVEADSDDEDHEDEKAASPVLSGFKRGAALDFAEGEAAKATMKQRKLLGKIFATLKAALATEPKLGSFFAISSYSGAAPPAGKAFDFDSDQVARWFQARFAGKSLARVQASVDSGFGEDTRRQHYATDPDFCNAVGALFDAKSTRFEVLLNCQYWIVTLLAFKDPGLDLVGGSDGVAVVSGPAGCRLYRTTETQVRNWCASVTKEAKEALADYLVPDGAGGLVRALIHYDISIWENVWPKVLSAAIGISSHVKNPDIAEGHRVGAVFFYLIQHAAVTCKLFLVETSSITTSANDVLGILADPEEVDPTQPKPVFNDRISHPFQIADLVPKEVGDDPDDDDEGDDGDSEEPAAATRSRARKQPAKQRQRGGKKRGGRSGTGKKKGKSKGKGKAAAGAAAAAPSTSSASSSSGGSGASTRGAAAASRTAPLPPTTSTGAAASRGRK